MEGMVVKPETLSTGVVEVASSSDMTLFVVLSGCKEGEGRANVVCFVRTLLWFDEMGKSLQIS